MKLFLSIFAIALFLSNNSMSEQPSYYAEEQEVYEQPSYYTEEQEVYEQPSYYTEEQETHKKLPYYIDAEKNNKKNAQPTYSSQTKNKLSPAQLLEKQLLEQRLNKKNNKKIA